MNPLFKKILVDEKMQNKNHSSSLQSCYLSMLAFFHTVLIILAMPITLLSSHWYYSSHYF